MAFPRFGNISTIGGGGPWPILGGLTPYPDWDQDGSRVKKLRDSAEYTIYTPGSQSGRA